MNRRLLTLRWLAGLLLALAGATAMVLLGRWQLHRGESTHSLQNYSYAVEWVLFAGFTVFCFYRFARDAVREGDRESPVGAPAAADVLLPRPPAVSDEAEDPELAAYNAYLAELHGSS